MLQMGFPIMIKATAGGGGRGMRLAHEPKDFLYLLRQAQQEAESAFGNNKVYLERYIQNPRHIEFQVGLPSAALCRHSCRQAGPWQVVRQCHWGGSVTQATQHHHYAWLSMSQLSHCSRSVPQDTT